MKALSYFLILSMNFPIFLNGQTILRFHPNKTTKNAKGNFTSEGKAEQIGDKFSGNLRIELPDRILQLNLKQSSLKQYDRLFTSNGEIPSKVEFYEDKNQQESYFVAVIDKQFYSLSIIESEKYFTLEKHGDVQFIYQKNEIGNETNLAINDYYLPESNRATPPINQQLRRIMLNGCFEFPIGFICDYEHFKQKQKSVSEIEADNLIMLATSQEVWSKNSFEGEVKFKTIGQLIYTSPDQMPWSDDVSLPLSNIWNELLGSSKNIESWQKYNLLTKVGLTGNNYEKNTIWGWGGGSPSISSMGAVVMKSFLNKNQLKWLFAHELGHVFGASHDGGNFVMNGTYESSSLFWSTSSKNSVNNTLNRLNSFNWLGACHILSLNWALSNDSLTFKWQTNIDALGDTFTLEFSNDNQQTWKVLSTVNSTGTFKYERNIQNLLRNGESNFFRVSQRGNNPTQSESIAVIITEIEGDLPNKTISIFPNPFDNYLKINVLSPNEVKIYDGLGRLVKQFNENEKQFFIDTSLWKTGVYFIQIGNNSNEVFKVFKQ